MVIDWLRGADRGRYKPQRILALRQAPNILLALQHPPSLLWVISATSLQLTDVSKTFAVGSPIPLDQLNPGGTPVAAVPQTCPAVGRYRYMVGASADSGRVYVSSCDAGGTYILPTSNDTPLLLLTSPGQPPFTGAVIPQNPVFLITGR